MLKKLALKFKNQSLNEVRPYEPQLFLPHESDIQDLEKSDEEDEEITDINYDSTTASPSFNENNNVKASNSKIAPAFYPTFTSSNEHIPLDEGRKTEAVSLKFTPIEGPVVRDYTCSAEKRKWSQMNAHKLLHQLASGGDSSSSDDEVKEICCIKKPPYLDLAAPSSSPPGKAPKHSDFTSRSRTVRLTEGHARSRKKHRLVFAECGGDRPSLDFEKMQKITIRKSHSSARARVKIRAISNSGQQPSLCNPEVLCFRPIQFSAHRSLAPVEEPGFAF